MAVLFTRMHDKALQRLVDEQDREKRRLDEQVRCLNGALQRRDEVLQRLVDDQDRDKQRLDEQMRCLDGALQRRDEALQRRDEALQRSDGALQRRDEELARREEATVRMLGQISAQYMSRVLLDMGIRRYLFRTTGRPSGKAFADRLREFLHATIVPEGGATVAQPVRPEFREDYDRLRELLGFSLEGVLRQLRDVVYLATELNAPHHEVMTLHGPPGFYVAGRQFSNEQVVVIALTCAALQRDESDCFPSVHVLTRNDVLTFHVREGTVQAAM